MTEMKKMIIDYIFFYIIFLKRQTPENQIAQIYRSAQTICNRMLTETQHRKILTL